MAVRRRARYVPVPARGRVGARRRHAMVAVGVVIGGSHGARGLVGRRSSGGFAVRSARAVAV